MITSDDTLAEACRSIHNCGRIAGGLWYEHHVMSGNYRLGEFQGAVLNAQLDRLEEQTLTRDRNGQYLAARLSRIPGIHPQKRPADCTRHSYHLFLLRIDAQAFGAPREAILKALQAEGIPVCGGYALPLYRQPLFLNKAFGPYLPRAAAKLDYGSGPLPQLRADLRRAGRLARTEPVPRLPVGHGRHRPRVREGLRKPRGAKQLGQGEISLKVVTALKVSAVAHANDDLD